MFSSYRIYRNGDNDPVIAAIVIALMKNLSTDEAVERNRLETDRLKERVSVSEAELHSRMDNIDKRMDKMNDLQNGLQNYIDQGEEKLLTGQKETPRYCPHCGAVVPGQAVFCPSCGKKLL